MKSFKYITLALSIFLLTACGTTEEVNTETTDNETAKESTEIVVETKTSETKDIVESEDMTDLKLDNALLELDLVE